MPYNVYVWVIKNNFKANKLISVVAELHLLQLF